MPEAMPILVAVLVAFWVAYVGFSISARSDFPWKRRRSHFWARVALVCLVPPLWLLLAFLLLDAHLLPEHPMASILWCTCLAWVPAAACAPALFYQRECQSPGASDDGGGGSAPDPSPASPASPRGGIPLPDAGPGQWRLRDHDRPETHNPIERRPAHEPDRTPTLATGPRQPRSHAARLARDGSVAGLRSGYQGSVTWGASSSV
jgi:hypothetical protein